MNTQVFKTDRYLFGVWQVKSKRDTMYGQETGVLYWDSEEAAWDHLRKRADEEVVKAQRALDKAHRNRAKAMKKQRELRTEGFKQAISTALEIADSRKTE